MADTIGSKGLGVLLGLGKLVLTLYGTLADLRLRGAWAPSRSIARIPLRRFIRAAREPFILAFSTASSEAALPLALENMELMGVPPHIVAFVLPTGYSFNLDGSTLISFHGVDLRSASRGHSHGRSASSFDDADTDAHQQGRGRASRAHRW